MFDCGRQRDYYLSQMEEQSTGIPASETEVVETLVFDTVDDGPPIVRKIPLSGWLERQGFHPLLSAFLMFVLTFILFQGIASVVALVIVVAQQGGPRSSRPHANA